MSIFITEFKGVMDVILRRGGNNHLNCYQFNKFNLKDEIEENDIKCIELLEILAPQKDENSPL